MVKAVLKTLELPKLSDKSSLKGPGARQKQKIVFRKCQKKYRREAQESGNVRFLFSRSLLLVFTKNILEKEHWALG